MGKTNPLVPVDLSNSRHDIRSLSLPSRVVTSQLLVSASALLVCRSSCPNRPLRNLRIEANRVPPRGSSEPVPRPQRLAVKAIVCVRRPFGYRLLHFFLPHARPVPVKSWSCTTSSSVVRPPRCRGGTRGRRWRRCGRRPGGDLRRRQSGEQGRPGGSGGGAGRRRRGGGRRVPRV